MEIVYGQAPSGSTVQAISMPQAAWAVVVAQKLSVAARKGGAKGGGGNVVYAVLNMAQAVAAAAAAFSTRELPEDRGRAGRHQAHSTSTTDASGTSREEEARDGKEEGVAWETWNEKRAGKAWEYQFNPCIERPAQHQCMGGHHLLGALCL